MEKKNQPWVFFFQSWHPLGNWPSKSKWQGSLFFFGPSARPPPLGSGSMFHHPLGSNVSWASTLTIIPESWPKHCPSCASWHCSQSKLASSYKPPQAAQGHEDPPLGCGSLCPEADDVLQCNSWSGNDFVMGSSHPLNYSGSRRWIVRMMVLHLHRPCSKLSSTLGSLIK